MSAHRNIPIKLGSRNNSNDRVGSNNMQAVIRELSKEDLKSSKQGSVVGSQYRNSTKKRKNKSRTAKLLNPNKTQEAHMDPKRKLNLLESSGGLSEEEEELDANLSGHQYQMESSGEKAYSGTYGTEETVKRQNDRK